MPTVVLEGQFRLVANAGNCPTYTSGGGDQDACRMELNGGAFMEPPPAGTFRMFLKAHAKHAEAIGKAWDTHSREAGDNGSCSGQ